MTSDFLSPPASLTFETAPGPAPRPAERQTAGLVARPRLTEPLLAEATGLAALTAPPGCGKASLLRLLAAEATARGLRTEVCDAPPAAESLAARLHEAATAPAETAPQLWLLSGTAACPDEVFSRLIAPALLAAARSARVIFAEPRLRSAPLREAWLRRDMLVLTAAELRFDASEARSLPGPALTPAELGALLNYSDGWIAALRHLTPADLRADAPLPPALSAWYEEEVCRALDPEGLRLMMDLSVAGSFPPALLNALPARSDGSRPGWNALAPLLRDGLLIRQLPQGAGELRIQPAFAAFLRERLRRHAPARAALMQDFILSWWAGSADKSELARHALRLEDADRAARLLEEAGGITCDMGDGPEMARDLPVDAGFAAEMPLVFLGQIYQRARNGRLEEAELLFHHARRETGDFTRLNRTADALEIRAWMLMIDLVLHTGFDRDPPEELLADLKECFSACLGRLPVVALSLASVLAFSALEAQDYPTARRMITLGLNMKHQEPRSKSLIFLNVYLSRLHLATGSAEAALQAVTEASSLAALECAPRGYEALTCDIWRGICLAEAGETAAALTLLRRTMQDARFVYGYVTLYTSGWAALARLLRQTEGEAATRQLLSEVRDFARLRDLPRLVQEMDLLGAELCGQPLPRALPRGASAVRAVLLRARRALEDQRPAEAVRELDSLPDPIPDQRHNLSGLLLRIRAELAQRRYSAALRATEDLLPLLCESQNRRIAAEALPWLLSVRSQCHRGGRSLSAEALRLLEEVQLWLPEPGEMQDLPPSSGNLLSPREGEVIALVAEGLITKEIARRLGISEGTVKSHRKKIHEKLNVTTRSQAILQARALGLI